MLFTRKSKESNRRAISCEMVLNWCVPGWVSHDGVQSSVLYGRQPLQPIAEKMEDDLSKISDRVRPITYLAPFSSFTETIHTKTIDSLFLWRQPNCWCLAFQSTLIHSIWFFFLFLYSIFYTITVWYQSVIETVKTVQMSWYENSDWFWIGLACCCSKSSRWLRGGHLCVWWHAPNRERPFSASPFALCVVCLTIEKISIKKWRLFFFFFLLLFLFSSPTS